MTLHVDLLYVIHV